MRNKPLLFKLILVLFLIEPLIKILYFKASTHFDFATIFGNLAARNTFKEIFDFWLVFPVAALALIKIRKWSYFLFLGILGYIIFSILTYEQYTWPYNSATPFFYNYVIVALSMAIVAVFLLPKVREPFFDHRIRWWEANPRYKTSIPCKIRDSKTTFDGEILNISTSGAFLRESDLLALDQDFVLEFQYFDKSINLPMKVINKHSYGSQAGCGVQFKPKSLGQKAQIAKLIRDIKSRL